MSGFFFFFFLCISHAQHYGEEKSDNNDFRKLRIFRLRLNFWCTDHCVYIIYLWTRFAVHLLRHENELIFRITEGKIKGTEGPRTSKNGICKNKWFLMLDYRATLNWIGWLGTRKSGERDVQLKNQPQGWIRKKYIYICIFLIVRALIKVLEVFFYYLTAWLFLLRVII